MTDDEKFMFQTELRETEEAKGSPIKRALTLPKRDRVQTMKARDPKKVMLGFLPDIGRQPQLKSKWLE